MNVGNLRGERIAIVSTVPFFLVNQLSGHIENLICLGMHVTVITSPGKELNELSRDKNLHIVEIEIARKISPWRDLTALIRLLLLFRRGRYSIVHSTTPKAGFLCALAARFAEVPVRIHTFTGQVWATRKGIMRAFLKAMDRWIVSQNTHCYTDSPSQREFLLDEGIGSKVQISTYGKGSLAGVNLNRFSPDHFSDDDKKVLRAKLGIDVSAFVIIFIGRLVKDKGIQELLAAFERIRREAEDAVLLILGPEDEEEAKLFLEKAEEIGNVCYAGYVKNIEAYLAISNLLLLPSYREGFGTVVIEAAAMGLPTVGSRIPGLSDAIEDGVTGMLFPVGDVDALTTEIRKFYTDRAMLRQMSKAARRRCEEEFDSALVHRLIAAEYSRWLEAKG